MSKGTLTYDADYFIEKFEAIPDEKWCEGSYSDGKGRHCVLGHCGVIAVHVLTAESRALSEILGGSVAAVNDGHPDCGYHQHTPKARILAALRDAKKKEEGS